MARTWTKLLTRSALSAFPTTRSKHKDKQTAAGHFLFSFEAITAKNIRPAPTKITTTPTIELDSLPEVLGILKTAAISWLFWPPRVLFRTGGTPLQVGEAG